jgi:MFS family permease
MTASPWRTPILILVCASVVLILSFGIRTSFGIFLAPVTSDLGLGREVFALAIAIQSLLWGISQPFAGAIADRYGSGRVIAVCGVLYVIGLVMMAHASTGADLVLSNGILIGIALSGTGFPVILAVVARSVDESRRSLFLGLAGAGGSSGQVLMVPLGQIFLDGFGWSEALIGLALLSAITVRKRSPKRAATAATGISPPAFSCAASTSPSSRRTCRRSSPTGAAPRRSGRRRSR